MFCLILSSLIFILLAYVFFKLDSTLMLAFYSKFFPNKDKLRGKTVWVVGSSSGIGEELAYQLAELNCKLILTSTTESKLQEVKENCIKRSNNNLKSDDILVLAYDISDFPKNDEAFKKIIDKFGQIDVVINNAARVMATKVIDDDMELHKKLFDINYLANMQIAKIVVRHWLKTKFNGTIFVTSSIIVFSDIPYFSAYGISKKAINTFYRDLAMQHKKDKISVVNVCPGPVKTEIAKKSLNKQNLGDDFNMENAGAMSCERCAHLSLIALANRISESWICEQPILFGVYLSDKFHFEFFQIFKLFNLIKFFDRVFKKNE